MNLRPLDPQASQSVSLGPPKSRIPIYFRVSDDCGCWRIPSNEMHKVTYKVTWSRPGQGPALATPECRGCYGGRSSRSAGTRGRIRHGGGGWPTGWRAATPGDQPADAARLGSAGRERSGASAWGDDRIGAAHGRSRARGQGTTAGQRDLADGRLSRESSCSAMMLSIDGWRALPGQALRRVGRP